MRTFGRGGRRNRLNYDSLHGGGRELTNTTKNNSEIPQGEKEIPSQVDSTKQLILDAIEK